MQLQDVTFETAVVLLAETAGLKPVRVGNVVFLTTKEHAKAMFSLEIDPTTKLPIPPPDVDSPLIGPIPLPDEFGPGGGGPPLQVM